MKPKWIIALGIVLMTAQALAEEASLLKTPKDMVNYSLGVGIARNFKRQGIEIDQELVIKGLRDVLSGGKLLMTEKELRKTMNDLQAEVRRNQAAAIRVATVENKKKGDAFLAENRTKEGVVSLPSGLQYKILKAGGGRKPTDADEVEVNYRGTLIDGTEFDSTERAGKPAVLKVKGGVIPGWSEALKLMPAGSKWQIVVPPPLAYGERGVGTEIGPNETLIFDVELLSIK